MVFPVNSSVFSGSIEPSWLDSNEFDLLNESNFDQVIEYFNAAENVTPLLRWLGSRGTKFSARDEDGLVLLHYAARKGCLSLVEYLISWVGGLDVRTNSGETPLHFASEAGHLALVQKLISLGADVNAEDENGLTPERTAFLNDHSVIVQTFKAHRNAQISNVFENTVLEDVSKKLKFVRFSE